MTGDWLRHRHRHRPGPQLPAARRARGGDSRCVLLQTQAPALRRPHTLDRHGDAQAQEVVEPELLRVLQPVEQQLHAPELAVDDAEHRLDPVVRDAARSDHPVEVLLDADAAGA